MSKTPQTTVRTADAAKQLGVHPSTLTRWVAAEKITPVLRGTGDKGEMFFDQADITRIRQTGKVSAA
jgi:DNA-binding transcriptional MerR regulator